MRVLIKLLISGGIVAVLILFAISSYRQFTATGGVDPQDSISDVAAAAIQTRDAIYSGIRKTHDIGAPLDVSSLNELMNHEPPENGADPTLSEVLSIDSLWIKDADTGQAVEGGNHDSSLKEHLSGEQLDEIIATILEAEKLLGGRYGQ